MVGLGDVSEVCHFFCIKRKNVSTSVKSENQNISIVTVVIFSADRPWLSVIDFGCLEKFESHQYGKQQPI